MARIDKYDPKSGGFRAALAADRAATPGAIGDADGPIGVGLDANGRVVAGAGNTGVVGVLVLTQNKVAGDIVDIMTDGELVEAGGTAGTTYYADGGTGALGTAAPAAGANGTRVGRTVEAGRLVVRVQTVQG